MSFQLRTKTDTYPFISPSSYLKDAAYGKAVLITGGSRGIGRAIAISFAKAGASTLILAARRQTSLEETKASILALAPTCTVLVFPTDISDESSVGKLFSSLPRTPNVVVNNAGTFHASTILDSDTSKWWADFETGVKGSYLCIRAYLRLLAGGPGTILNVSSLSSIMLNPDQSSYGTSKTAINRLTSFVHAEHAAQGVRCIAFHPGGVADTDIGEKAPKWLRERLTDTLELAADTALYLSTERAGWLSGRFVLANWNMERLEGLRERIEREDLLKTGVAVGGEILEAGPVVAEQE
ncbi:MAG: hypothetical protein MMC23_001446 [Stictis urceolatum]|nr:hypothetical protein [Stictis urceolata]